MAVLSLATLIVVGCSSQDSSAPDRRASAVDACQRARAIDAPVANPSPGATTDRYMVDLLESLVDRTDAVSGGSRIPLFPSFGGSSALDGIERDVDYLVRLLEADQEQRARVPVALPPISSSAGLWISPPSHVVQERVDAINVALIRSDDAGLISAFEAGIDGLREECVRLGYLD